MGCDIHTHIEIKVNDKWYNYSQLNIDRNYQLFAKLANVRNYDDIPYFEPKGLPEDVSFITQHHWNTWWSVDGHNPSYLTSHELEELHTWLCQQDFYTWRWDMENLGYVHGNSLFGFHNYPEEYKGIDDIRMVFWFDN